MSAGRRLTRQEEHELYERLKDESFYCETCGSQHPLREHRECRATIAEAEAYSDGRAE